MGLRRNNMSIYRKILGQAWVITWQNKYLWFFGLFTALLLGNGGEVLVKFLDMNSDQPFFDWNMLASTGIFSREGLANFGHMAKTDPATFVMVIIMALVILVLAAFLVWLSIVSQAALVNNVYGHIGGKSGDFKSGIMSGMKNFWPVLGMNLLLKIITGVCFIIVTLPFVYLISRAGAAVSSVIYLIAFVLLMIVILSVSFILKYAIVYLVVKEHNLAEALKAGWKLFVKNWIVSIEMAVTLFVVSVLVSLAYLLLLLVFAIPFVLLFMVAAKISKIVFGTIVIVAIIAYLISLAFVGSTLATFQVSAWTILYKELLNKGVVAKVVRLAEEWKK